MAASPEDHLSSLHSIPPFVSSERISSTEKGESECQFVLDPFFGIGGRDFRGFWGAEAPPAIRDSVASTILDLHGPFPCGFPPRERGELKHERLPGETLKVGSEGCAYIDLLEEGRSLPSQLH